MIAGSDLIVVPCPPDAQAVATLRMLFAQFRQLGATNYRVLLVNVPPPPQRDGDEYRSLLADLQIPTFKRSIRSAKAFRKASMQGCTVDRVSDDRRSYVAWYDYEEVGREIDEILANQAVSRLQWAS